MFVYLSKKINVPAVEELTCVRWNKSLGYLCIGGTRGYLRMLGLGKESLTAANKIEKSQTLVSHSHSIKKVCFNTIHRKLASVDEDGKIVIWLEHESEYFEEMVNNRMKSVVTDLKWSKDGKKICIVYQDGMVIAGTVEGTRLWTRTLKYKLKYAEWSPDNKSLLLSTEDNRILIIDAKKGLFVNFFQFSTKNKTIKSIQWYDEVTLGPCIIVAFETGEIELFRSEVDEYPYLVKTNIHIRDVKWSNDGSFFIVGGFDANEENVVQIYDNFGNFSQTITIARVKSTSKKAKHSRKNEKPFINEVSIDKNDMRISVIIGDYIFFCVVRPFFEATVFKNTLVYSLPLKDRPEDTLVFWSLLTNEKKIKIYKRIKFIRSNKHFLYLIQQDSSEGVSLPDETGGNDENEDSNNNAGGNNRKNLRHRLVVLDEIGNQLSFKEFKFHPKFTCPIGDSTVICCSSFRVLILIGVSPKVKNKVRSEMSETVGRFLNKEKQQQQQQQGGGDETKSSSLVKEIDRGRRQRGKKNERIVDGITIDLRDIQEENVNGEFGTSYEWDNTQKIQMKSFHVNSKNENKDEIVCLEQCFPIFLLGRESGFIQIYSVFPTVQLKSTVSFKCSLKRMFLSHDLQKLAIFDGNHHLRVFEIGFDQNHKLTKAKKSFNDEKRQFWAFQWNESNSNFCCGMEKDRLLCFRGTHVEEPIRSTSYPFHYGKNLVIQSLRLDEIIKGGEKFLRNVKSLRQSLVKGGKNISKKKENAEENEKNKQKSQEEKEKKLLEKEYNRYFIEFETKSRRDVRRLLDRVGIEECYQYLLEHEDDSLYELFCERCLEEMNLKFATKGFIKLKDLRGIHLIEKELKNISNEHLRKAMIMNYFGKFTKSERIFRKIDRLDLMMEQKQKYGDWFFVLNLLQQQEEQNGDGNFDDDYDDDSEDNESEEEEDGFGSRNRKKRGKKKGKKRGKRRKEEKLNKSFDVGGNNVFLNRSELKKKCHEEIGQYYMSRFEYEKALKHFEGSENIEGRIDCLFYLDDHEGLEKIIDETNEEAILLSIGKKLHLMGIDPSKAYEKAGHPSLALDSCIRFKEFDLAVGLVEKHSDLFESNALRQTVLDYSEEVSNGLGLIELFKSAKDLVSLNQLYSTMISNESNVLKQKQLCVKNAFDVQDIFEEDLKRKLIDSSSSRIWEGAEAFHFLNLCNRQFLQGEINEALLTSLRLTNYEKIKSFSKQRERVYALIVLFSVAARKSWLASKYCSKLELMDKKKYRDFAVDLFSNLKIENRKEQKEQKEYHITCPKCKGKTLSYVHRCQHCQFDIPYSVFSGRSLKNLQTAWKCSHCSHYTTEKERMAFQFCPLCHRDVKDL